MYLEWKLKSKPPPVGVNRGNKYKYMYTLIRISGNGVQMNQALGGSYTVVKREENPHDFKRSMDAYLGRQDDDHLIYAFVCNGPILQPLWENQKAFIMTEGGKTFDNLSHGKY